MAHKSKQHVGAKKTSVSEVFLANLGGLKSHLSRLLHSRHDIEDVLQDTYIRAVQAEKVTEIEAPQAFLYKICQNLALNHNSKAAHRLTDYIADFEEHDVLGGGSSLDYQLHQENRFVTFCSAVKVLPAQCRQVFVLKKVYGLSNKEIAQRLDIAVSTVDKHIGRGMVACRNYLEVNGYSFGGRGDTNAVAKR